MARCLIVACGCRGRMLARELSVRGLPVRGTTRTAAHLQTIEATGAEALIGDPDRIATLAPALEEASVACLLLGSAVGPSRSLAALHSSRLAMLLARMLDSPVRGVVYEAAGSVEPRLLSAGAESVRAFCERSRLPAALLTADPGDHQRWLAAALEAVDLVLARQ